MHPDTRLQIAQPRIKFFDFTDRGPSQRFEQFQRSVQLSASFQDKGPVLFPSFYLFGGHVQQFVQVVGQRGVPVVHGHRAFLFRKNVQQHLISFHWNQHGFRLLEVIGQPCNVGPDGLGQRLNGQFKFMVRGFFFQTHDVQPFRGTF